MGLWQWSTTAANNATADPSINWQEGQAPSTVNDSARAMMAAIAAQFQTGWEWQEFGDTPTYVSATSFTVPGNLTSRYTSGRRVRTTNTGGTFYGLITSSVFTSLTTVTVLLDSGNLDGGLSEVDVGILNPANSSFPTGLNPGFGSATIGYSGSGAFSGVLRFTGQGSYAPTMRSNGSLSRLEWVNSANTLVTMSLTDTGNLTTAGTVTQNSDERLKYDIEQIDNALARVKKLRGVTYRWKGNARDSARQTGLIAQHVKTVMPEAVKEGPDGHLSVAYGNLVGLLVEAVKQLSEEVDALKSRES